jgi:hypothetical protein
MPDNFRLGKDGKLYLFAYGGRLFNDGSGSPDYGTVADIFTSATANTDYAIYTNCRDVTLTLDTEEVDITSRATSGFKASVATSKESTIEFEAVWKPGDTFFGWIKDAWKNSAEIAVVAMDGPYNTSGNSGLVGNFTVPGFNRQEPIGDIMRAAITLKGSSYIDWYEAS